MTTKNNRPKYINVLASSTLALSLFAGVAAPSVGAEEPAPTSHYSATTAKDFIKQVSGLKVTADKFDEKARELKADLDTLSTTDTVSVDVKTKIENFIKAIPTVKAYNEIGDIKKAVTDVKAVAPVFTKGTLKTTADVATAVANATSSLDTVTVKLNAFENAYPTSDTAVIALVKSFQSKVKGLDKAVTAKEKELDAYIAADAFLVAADQVPTFKDVKSKGLKTAEDLVKKASDLYTTEDAIKIVAALDAYNALKKPAATASTTDTALAKEALKTKAVKDAFKAFSKVQKDYQVQEKLQVKVVEADIKKLNRKLTNYVASVDAATAAYKALETSNEAVFKAIKAGTVEKLQGHEAAASFVTTVDAAFTEMVADLGTTYDTALVKRSVNLLSSEDIATVKAELNRIKTAAAGTLHTNAKVNKAAKGLIKSDLKTIDELLKLIDARVKALGNANITAADGWNDSITQLTLNATGEYALDPKKDFKKLSKTELIAHLENYSDVKELTVQAREAYSKLSKDEQKLVPKAELKVLTDAEGYFKKELAAVKTTYKAEITAFTNEIKALKTDAADYTTKFAAALAKYDVDTTEKLAIRDAVAVASLDKLAQHAMVLNFATSFKAGAQLATNDAGKVAVTTKDVAGISTFVATTTDTAALTFTAAKAKELINAGTPDTALIATYKKQVELYTEYYNAFGGDKTGKALKSLVSPQYKILTAVKKELEKTPKK